MKGYSHALDVIEGHAKHEPQQLVSKVRNPGDIMQTKDKPEDDEQEVKENILRLKDGS